MKIIFLTTAALLLVLVSELTHANERPLLGKYNYPGYVMDEHYHATSCELFASGHVIRTTTKGSARVATYETMKIELSMETVRSLMLQAVSEEMEETDNYLCDAPSTAMIAYVEKNVSPDGIHTLYSTGGCGSPRLRTVGPASKKLFALLAKYCPTTH